MAGLGEGGDKEGCLSRYVGRLERVSERAYKDGDEVGW